MQFLRALIKTSLFVGATLGLYGAWFLTHFLVPNKIHWRQMTFYYWTQSFIWISGMKIETIGTPPTPPFFLVTNHLSYTDMAALRAVAKGVFVAKGEIEGWPLGGRIVRDMGTIFINRANRRDIPRAGEEIMKRLDAGEGVIVFPEGTSTEGKTVLPFNSSFLQFAAASGTPVSYAAINYQISPDSLPASISVCWGEDISFFAHLWRLMKQRGYTATITFGEKPITNADRKALAAELRDRVAEKFIPVV